MEFIKNVEIRMDDSEGRSGRDNYSVEYGASYHVAWCDTIEEAIDFIKTEVKKTLLETIRYAKTLEEFLEMALEHPVCYFTITKDDNKKVSFPTYEYVQEQRKLVWEEKYLKI